jgi:hypothetical protein
MISGAGATGANQIIKQLFESDSADDQGTGKANG